MTDKEIRAVILEFAYNNARKWGLLKGGISLMEISKDWEEPREKIDFNADYLDGKGWVIWLDRKAFGGVMRITVAGIDEYERTHGAK